MKRPEEERVEGSGGITFRLSGLSCPECAAQFQRGLAGLEGMKRVELNYGAGLLRTEGPYGPNEIARLASRQSVQAVRLHRAGKPHSHGRSRPRQHRRQLVLLTLGVLLVAAGAAVEAAGLQWPPVLLETAPPQLTPGRLIAAAALVLGGYHPVKRALGGLVRRRVDASFTAMCASLGAVLLGRWLEAAAVLCIFSGSELLQASSMDKLRRFVWEWAARLPEHAFCLVDGQPRRVPVDQIAPGDVCVVDPGEPFPVDGVVVEGVSEVSQGPWGVSEPVRRVGEGDRVDAGSLNGDWQVWVRAERPAKESAGWAALERVTGALNTPGPGHEWAQRAAARMARLLLYAAVGVAALPPLLLGAAFGTWLYTALILALLALPCALSLSVPAAFGAAVVAGVRGGVLFQSGEALGRLGRVDAVAFEPGAVLTAERLDVCEVYPLPGWSRQEALALAAGVLWGRYDAAGEAVVRAAQEAGSGVVAVDSVRTDEYGNVEAVAGERLFAFGELASLERRGIALTPVLPKINALRREGVRIALVVEGKEPVAVFALVETVNEESKKALRRARAVGIRHLAMVSGEETRQAARAAAELEVDQHLAGLRAGRRLEAIRALQRQRRRVAVVRPCTGPRGTASAADVDIVFGPWDEVRRFGRADVMLVGESFERLPFALSLARRTLRVIRQNIAVVLGLKALALALLLSGGLTLWLAAALEFLAAAAVAANAARLVKKTRRPWTGAARRAG